MAAVPRIAIDCMGGDHGLKTTIPAALRFLAIHDTARLQLYGDKDAIAERLGRRFRKYEDRISIIDCEESIAMDDSLETALRKKRNSSMHMALHAVKQKEADVCVSAGNTAALMAVSRYILKTIALVERPALCALIPNQNNKPTYALDLGANVDCSALQLEQFALMGSVFCAVGEGIVPRVGLINIGTEDMKGVKAVRDAHQLLLDEKSKRNINYIGFVEGNDIFFGQVDVVVCDGFAGNVALKAMEGLSFMIKKIIRDGFKHNLYSRFAAAISVPVLRRIQGDLSSARYNGACLLGLKGLVYKSHGGATAEGFCHALIRASKAVEGNLLAAIESRMTTVFGHSAADETLQ